MSPARKGVTKRTRAQPLTHLHKRRHSQKGHNKAPTPAAAQKYPFETATEDASEQGKHALEWLFHPIKATKFFSTHFEKETLHLRNGDKKFSFLASLASIRSLITSKKLTYNELDVTSYTSEHGRVTHNGTGAAGPEALDRYDEGCSLRLRRPQDHYPAIRALCTHLESFLECVVGANIYATPANSQGFAPHFDDVDAVVCQIAGRKLWRVYKRADEHDVLPRRSSVDFGKGDTKDMTLVKEVLLEQGDVLYLPRGAVHEAACAEGEVGSLHVTISFCQRWTWADLLLCSFERAVLETAARDRRLRESLPLGFGRIAGAARRADSSNLGRRFARTARAMTARVAEEFPVDAAADGLMTRFVEERLALPGVAESRSGMITEKCLVRAKGRAHVRLVEGEDGLPVLVGKGFRQTCLPEEANGTQFVVDAYPAPVRVREIPMRNLADRVELAGGLVDMGVFEVVE